MFEFERNGKFNLLKALLALSIDFSTFLINYMIKIIYFRLNLSKRENNRGLYLRKRFCRTTLISYLTYFLVKKMEFFQYLKSKHKIYILSRYVLIRICRPHLGK